MQTPSCIKLVTRPTLSVQLNLPSIAVERTAFAVMAETNFLIGRFPWSPYSFRLVAQVLGLGVSLELGQVGTWVSSVTWPAN